MVSHQENTLVLCDADTMFSEPVSGTRYINSSVLDVFQGCITTVLNKWEVDPEHIALALLRRDTVDTTITHDELNAMNLFSELNILNKRISTQSTVSDLLKHYAAIKNILNALKVHVCGASESQAQVQAYAVAIEANAAMRLGQAIAAMQQDLQIVWMLPASHNPKEIETAYLRCGPAVRLFIQAAAIDPTVTTDRFKTTKETFDNLRPTSHFQRVICMGREQVAPSEFKRGVTVHNIMVASSDKGAMTEDMRKALVSPNPIKRPVARKSAFSLGPRAERTNDGENRVRVLSEYRSRLRPSTTDAPRTALSLLESSPLRREPKPL